MGQKEILDFLRQRPENWHSVNDIISDIGVSRSSCIACLNRMTRYDEVHHIKMPGRSSERAPKLYRFKKQ
jgi:hypothetical protein